MKKIISLFVIGMCFLTGCSSLAYTRTANTSEQSAEEELSESFSLDQYCFEIHTPKGFVENDKENLDMQLYNEDEGLFISVFAYYDMDLNADETAESLFRVQNEDLFGKREYVTELEEMQITEMEDKTVYSCMYSAEREGIKNYYCVYMLDFRYADEKMWVLINGVPSSVMSYRTEIDRIVENITTKSESIKNIF